ncbi:MAG: aminodeoxychorismate/anthranilate synthase component II [Bacteroidia bacterium]|nr:aminodeoxychorismate/anthranilate synthase component II [Bacteroidia bacterium]
MSILVLDNYDSFTYNLVHYIEQVTDEPVEVFRNDAISVEETGRFSKILLSPGPGIPSEAGIMKRLIETCGATHSILGVCLGLQAIGEVYGGRIVNLEKVYHGVATPVDVHGDSSLFKGIPHSFNAGRYHSWVVDLNSLPEELEVTATDREGRVMSLCHKKYNVRGVQFHPESILTEHGLQLIRNWTEIE